MFGKGFFFIAFCMALIAASVGAVLHYAAGVTAVEAAFCALAVLFGLLTVESVSARARDRVENNERIEALARASADIARQVGDLSVRLEKIENAPAQEENFKIHIEPLAKEIGDLAELVGDLAGTVSEHESMLAQKQIFATSPEAAARAVAEIASAQTQHAAAPARVAGPVNPLAELKDNDVAALLKDALANQRIDVHLQPIVTLPQRKVRFYEAVSRLRLPEGKLIEAVHFIDAARRSGAVLSLDENLVQSAVQVVRRLATKSKDVGLFFNLASETLSERAAMTPIMNVLDANKAIAPSLIIEIAQSDFRSPNAVYRDSLHQLRERGFRLAIDHVTDLHIDPQAMAERGVRYLKIGAELLLGRVPQTGAQVHPADLVDLLGRYGIDLVAEKIETEATVVDLLDFDLGFGQGNLFAPPRPVRTEVLKGEIAEFPAPETKAPEPAPRTNDLAKLAARTVRRA
ncbi:MAG: EAL domain-containing protein [Xanthobacteraceae bacterium]|nr:EAL domain-containing protein [Xanthobacteraceae bacterium]MBX3548644.1 EAL domain-containing protein [Xanthobacteraceae bacterium]MCW5673805.1 EAL domain-containing protein [Xanthobacteraceae bacterium]